MRRLRYSALKRKYGWEDTMSGQLTAVFILWVAAAMSQAAEVYKIVDADGNITYTDQPGASAAERLNLPQINQTTAPAKRAEDKPAAETEANFAGYSSARISSPEDQAVILHNQVNIIVQLVLEPQLQPGHLVQFSVNGVAQGLPVSATAYQLDNIERGSHRIGVAVVNGRNRTLIVAKPVIVNVKRHFKRNQSGFQLRPKK